MRPIWWEGRVEHRVQFPVRDRYPFLAESEIGCKQKYPVQASSAIPKVSTRKMSSVG